MLCAIYLKLNRFLESCKPLVYTVRSGTRNKGVLFKIEGTINNCIVRGILHPSQELIKHLWLVSDVLLQTVPDEGLFHLLGLEL